MRHSVKHQFDQPSQRQRIPLIVQRQAAAAKPPRTRAAQLRLLGMSALAVGVMSLVSLSSAESRPVMSSDADAAAEVQMGPHAKRCVEMAMGRSVRRFAFEAAIRQDRLDPFHDERLARNLDHAKARCHAAFETARGSFSQFATADWEG